jgi:hypothetical protein
LDNPKKKCYKFSRAAPHLQDGSDTIPTRNKSYFKNVRNFDTLSKFTSELKKINETEKHAVPKHYFMVLLN